MKAKVISLFAWSLSLVVGVLAVFAWTNPNQGLQDINSYVLFPLFGLLAFSLMWTHYIVGAVRRLLGADKSVLGNYFEVTGWLAFIFIILHPTILITQLYLDGVGLPPKSYLEYVGPSMKWAVLIGTFSFLLFLGFEMKRWFKHKGWWPIIEYGNVWAIFAIIMHGLALGNDLQAGWFRAVWLIYAVLLAISVSYNYFFDIKHDVPDKKMKKITAVVVLAALIIGGSYVGYRQLSSSNTITSLVSDLPIKV